MLANEIFFVGLAAHVFTNTSKYPDLYYNADKLFYVTSYLQAQPTVNMSTSPTKNHNLDAIEMVFTFARGTPAKPRQPTN